ncbi:DNA-binding domain-containing protein [Reyranella sp.]|uniref:HvfC/BufC N-terminal domain-containing protein n=1 Tax=Reyranella sp. TaxID=1929291 RepID=UPI0025DED3FC|nr:DNA-binding domain-containing protein [Reyranella sp.]
MPLALPDLQAAFAAHVAGGDRADLAAAVVGDSISAEARLRIYRHHVAYSLGSALAATFATVHALVGEAFFRSMAQRFIGQTLPTQPVLTEYGAGFPAFVAGYEPAASLPYLEDVARLDWALNVAFHSPADRRLTAADLAGIAPERLPSLSIAVPAGTALIGSCYPLHRIWNASQPGASAEAVDLSAGRANLLVLRRADDAAFIVLDAGEAAFVASVVEGTSLEIAAERATSAGPSFDLSTAFARLLALEAFAAPQQKLGDGPLKAPG